MAKFQKGKYYSVVFYEDDELRLIERVGTYKCTYADDVWVCFSYDGASYEYNPMTISTKDIFITKDGIEYIADTHKRFICTADLILNR